VKRCDSCGGWVDPAEPWCPSCGHGGVELPSRRVLVLVAAGAVIAAGLLWPYFRPLGPHDYPRAKCRDNLREIALACHRYAEDNGGSFPDALDRLRPAYVTEQRVLSCPRAKGQATPSYVLIPGLRVEMPGATVLVYEVSGANHRTAGRNVAFVAGHVEWLREDEFAKRLAEQRRRLAGRQEGPVEPEAVP